MESKLFTEMQNFHFNLEKIAIQAQKIEDGLIEYSREWAQINSFRGKCKETQRTLGRLVKREIEG